MSNKAIITFYDPDGVIGLNRDDFNLDSHYAGVL